MNSFRETFDDIVNNIKHRNEDPRDRRRRERSERVAQARQDRDLDRAMAEYIAIYNKKFLMDRDGEYVFDGSIRERGFLDNVVHTKTKRQILRISESIGVESPSVFTVDELREYGDSEGMFNNLLGGWK